MTQKLAYKNHQVDIHNCHSKPELLDGRLPRRERSQSYQEERSHCHTAIVELFCTHFIGVIIANQRQGIAEIARLLVRILNKHCCFQDTDNGKDCNTADQAIALRNCKDVLRHTLHARHLHDTLSQQSNCSHHRQTAVLQLLCSQVFESSPEKPKGSKVPKGACAPIMFPSSHLGAGGASSDAAFLAVQGCTTLRPFTC